MAARRLYLYDGQSYNIGDQSLAALQGGPSRAFTDARLSLVAPVVRQTQPNRVLLGRGACKYSSFISAILSV